MIALPMPMAASHADGGGTYFVQSFSPEWHLHVRACSCVQAQAIQGRFPRWLMPCLQVRCAPDVAEMNAPLQAGLTATSNCTVSVWGGGGGDTAWEGQP